MRKFIPAILLAASLPALALAGPSHWGGGGGSGYGPCGGPGAGSQCDGTGPHARGGHGYGYGKHHGGFRHGYMNNLSAEQRDKMSNIMREQAKANWDIKQKYYNKLSEADRKAMVDDLQKSREETRKKMRAVLTPEQQKQFDEGQQRQDERSKEWQEFQQWKASKAAK